MDRGPAGQPLPALDADVHEDRIHLDHTSTAAGPFRRYQGRPGASEGIENQAAAVGAVADRVRDHGDRLDGGMQGQLALQSALADVVPDVGPVPAMPPER